jgi:hypothetical protein
MVFVACIVTMAIQANNSSCLDTKVSIPASKLSLKQALKLLSDQTSCTFSYNPLLINDQQILTISDISNTPLSKALRKILTSNITFTTQAKYILLHIVPVKTAVKTDSKISNDPRNAALVIPDFDTNGNYINSHRLRDTLAYVLPTIMPNVTVDSSLAVKHNSNIYTHTFDSLEIRRAKIEHFMRKNVQLQMGISSSSPISTALVQLGVYGLYAIATVSTDYNNSYRLGYGAGYQFDVRNNIGMKIQFAQNSLFAGQSYDLGVRATLSHIDLLATFAINRDFTLFIGPTFYLSKSSYIFTNQELDKIYGLGVQIGVKFDLISAILAKK